MFLRKKKTIKFSKALLKQFHQYTCARYGHLAELSTLGDNVNVRVFLASYMIAYRPTHVFEQLGELEVALLNSAKALQGCFETIVAAVHNGASRSQIPADVTRPFEQLLCEYLKCFKAWKVPDEMKLTCRIQHALIALYMAQGQLPRDEPEDSKLSVEFRTQIKRLRDKLSQIAGPDKLREFDNSRAEGRAIQGLPQPSEGGTTNLPERVSNEDLAHQLLLDSAFRLQDDGSMSERGQNAGVRIRREFHKVDSN